MTRNLKALGLAPLAAFALAAIGAQAASAAEEHEFETTVKSRCPCAALLRTC